MEQCPTLYPTIEEFQDFYSYVHWLDQQFKSCYGMVKIVPPKQWNPKCSDYQQKINEFRVNNPIEQNVQGASGYYEVKNLVIHKMSFKNYKKYSNNQSSKIEKLSFEQRQRLFWKNLTYSSPIYGADLEGSLMDSSAGAWNLNKLESLALYGLPKTLAGVTTPYCYIGTWKSFFCWHKEDLDLSAINYLFQGQPKIWYCIPSNDHQILQKQAQNHFKLQYLQCKQFLRHKTFLINPYILKQKYPKLKITKALHKAGQIMIAFGGSYHTGFNCGFNIAEAVNYGTLDWLKKLLKCKSCPCQKKSIKASLESILYNIEESSLFEKICYTKQFKKLQQFVKKQQQAQKNVQKTLKNHKNEKQYKEKRQKRLKKTSKTKKYGSQKVKNSQINKSKQIIKYKSSKYTNKYKKTRKTKQIN